MNKAFGQGGPLDDPLKGGKHNDSPRSLFAGTMGMFRNPAGHREVTYDDEAETAGSVALASALMRHWTGFRLGWPEQAARYRRRHRHRHAFTDAQEMKKTVRRLAIKLTRLLIGVVGGGSAVQDTSAVGILSTGRV